MLSHQDIADCCPARFVMTRRPYSSPYRLLFCNLSGFDCRDPQFRKALTMALRPAVVLPPLFFEDHDRPCPSLVDDFRRDLCALDQRLPDLESLVAVN